MSVSGLNLSRPNTDAVVVVAGQSCFYFRVVVYYDTSKHSIFYDNVISKWYKYHGEIVVIMWRQEAKIGNTSRVHLLSSHYWYNADAGQRRHLTLLGPPPGRLWEWGLSFCLPPPPPPFFTSASPPPFLPPCTSPPPSSMSVSAAPSLRLCSRETFLSAVQS